MFVRRLGNGAAAERSVGDAEAEDRLLKRPNPVSGAQKAEPQVDVLVAFCVFRIAEFLQKRGLHHQGRMGSCLF